MSKLFIETNTRNNIPNYIPCHTKTYRITYTCDQKAHTTWRAMNFVICYFHLFSCLWVNISKIIKITLWCACVDVIVRCMFTRARTRVVVLFKCRRHMIACSCDVPILDSWHMHHQGHKGYSMKYGPHMALCNLQL